MKHGYLKYISLLLVAAMMLAALAACTDKNGPANGGGDGTTASSGGDDPGSEPKTALEAAIAQYGDVSYLNGQKFIILSVDPGPSIYPYSGATENEIYYDEPNTEMLSNAIYQRNLKLETTLGITIQPLWGGSRTDVNTFVTLNDSAGDSSFNTVVNRIDYETTYATNGQLLNYYDIASVDPTHEWWDKGFVDVFTLYGNKLYTITGDLNYYDDYSVNIVLFSKQLCEQLNFEYPYQAVRDGTWTMDMMTEMANAAKAERSGDDILDPAAGDILGLADDNDCILHFLYSYGLSMTTKSANGEPVVADPTDNTMSVLEKVYDIINADYTYIAPDGYDGTMATVDYFKQNRILFFTELMGVLPALRDMETDYGVLPLPKGDPNMDSYRAYVSNGWSSCFGIPKTLSEAEAYDTGVILECMSAASKDIITPALYDQLLESKYIRDPESKEMLSYIFASKSYDLANDLDWAYSLRESYKGVREQGPAYFSRQYTKLQKALATQLANFCKSLSNG